MEVKGTIKVINATQVVSEKFSKRELVVTTNDTYPQDLLIQFTQDKCDVLNAYKVGQEVTIAINLRGREWINPQGEAKYFNTIEGWKIESNSSAPAPAPQATENDNLPF